MIYYIIFHLLCTIASIILAAKAFEEIHVFIVLMALFCGPLTLFVWGLCYCVAFHPNMFLLWKKKK